MSSNSTIRVGVIGTSFAGQVQIPGFQRFPDMQVVAVASARESRAQEVAARFNIPAAYGDYRRMLAEQELDLVSIVTPPYLHHEMVLAALEQPRHIMCEKPLAANVAQGREMLAAAEKAGVVHSVDFEFRYLPARVRMKELVEQGYLGELRTIRATNFNDVLLDLKGRPWSWWFQREKSGGALGAFGSHMIDSLVWWFGEIVEVAAQIDTFIKQRPLPDGSEWRDVTTDDQVSALFRLANGAPVTFNLSAVTRPAQSRFEAYGSEGTLVIEDARLLGAQGGAALEPIDLPAEREVVAGDDGRLGPFLTLLDRLLLRLRGENGPDFPTLHEGIHVQAVMDAIYQSADEQRFVTVER